MGIVNDYFSFQNGYAFKSVDFTENGEYKIIKIKELKDGSVKFFDDTAEINPSCDFDIEKYIIRKGDVLFALTGDPVSKPNPLSWVGRVSYYTHDEPALLNQRVCKAVPKGSVPNEYLYYFFRQESESFKLASKATGSASQANISTKTIEQHRMDIPDKDKMDKIVSVLRNIDEKIENNNQINRNLSEQAQSLFKSWFIQLDPFNGEVPENWSKGMLKDILQLRKDGTKVGKNTELPYLPIDVIPMNDLSITEVKPNEEAQSSLIMFNKNDILIGAMRVYFHRVVIAPFDGITRSTCFVLRPYNNVYLSFGLLCCNQRSSIDYAQATSKGSTMPYAIWDNGLGDMEITIPDIETASKFNKIIKPMLEIIQKSFYEVQRLQELRDILLPKLMSGELDVSDLNI